MEILEFGLTPIISSSLIDGISCECWFGTEPSNSFRDGKVVKGNPHLYFLDDLSFNALHFMHTVLFWFSRNLSTWWKNVKSRDPVSENTSLIVFYWQRWQ